MIIACKFTDLIEEKLHYLRDIVLDRLRSLHIMNIFCCFSQNQKNNYNTMLVVALGLTPLENHVHVIIYFFFKSFILKCKLLSPRPNA